MPLLSSDVIPRVPAWMQEHVSLSDPCLSCLTSLHRGQSHQATISSPGFPGRNLAAWAEGNCLEEWEALGTLPNHSV